MRCTPVVFAAILLCDPTTMNTNIASGKLSHQSNNISSYKHLFHEAVDGSANFEDQTSSRSYDNFESTNKERNNVQEIFNDEPTDKCNVGHVFSDGSLTSVPPKRNSCVCFYDTLFVDSHLETELDVNYAPSFNNDPDPNPPTSGNSRLFMDIWKPPNVMVGPLRPVIVLVHGGGCSVGERKRMAFHAKEFSKRGFVAASIDYRLLSTEISCRSSGSIEGAGSDAKAAIRYIEANSARLNIDPNRIAIMGSSAGGRISMYASFVEGNGVKQRPGAKWKNSQDHANYPGKISACVEISADFWAPNEDFPPKFQNNSPPLMIVHGKKDPNTWTKCSVAESNYQIALDANIYTEKYISPNAEHYVLNTDDSALEKIFNFLFKVLSLGSIDCQCISPSLSFQDKNETSRGDHSGVKHVPEITVGLILLILCSALGPILS